jgi:hypothetical protein
MKKRQKPKQEVQVSVSKAYAPTGNDMKKKLGHLKDLQRLTVDGKRSMKSPQKVS